LNFSNVPAALVDEFTATAILILFVCGVVANVNLQGTISLGSGWLSITEICFLGQFSVGYTYHFYKAYFASEYYCCQYR